ncbi:MAG: hypothetical protein MUF53_04560 [Gemmatimonadaceae bacterium]|nr:hypothetical protein [Gemmatimonadaceae bacterium]
MTPRYNASAVVRVARPAWRAMAVITLFAATMGSARAQVVVGREGTLLAQPANGARALGAVLPGGRLEAGPTRGAWRQVTIEGFLDRSVLAGKADTFPRSAKSDGVRVRAAAAADGRVVARLTRGTGVSVLGTSGTYVKVRRTGWVRTEALAAAPSASAAPSATTTNAARGVRPVPAGTTEAAPSLMAAPAAATAEPVPDGALKPADQGGAELRLSPDGRPLASAKPGAVLVPLVRDRGWVRVRLEGWVRERDLAPADSALRGIRSAADLRADPDGTKGAVVRWSVDVLGLQTADGLRRDLSDGEPYLLARGPDGEEALLYLAIPPTLLETARAWPPMSRALVVARVRTGRSEPTGVPVLDVQSLTRP